MLIYLSELDTAFFLRQWSHVFEQALNALLTSFGKKFVCKMDGKRRKRGAGGVNSSLSAQCLAAMSVGS